MLAVSLSWLNVVLGVICSVGFIVGFAWAIVKWATHGVARVAADKTGVGNLVKEATEAIRDVRHDMAVLNTRLENIEAQYKNNGGTSARDLWDRVEEHMRYVRADILRIDKAVERHLGYHEGAE